MKREFESPIPISGFYHVGNFDRGRIGIPRSALAAAKSGLTIAIKYSDQRRQFGPEGGLEVPILNYRIHQRRLLLCSQRHMQFILHYNTLRIVSLLKKNLKWREALAAGMKAYSTWSTTAVLQECREAIMAKVIYQKIVSML
jgi:acyl-CoA oxidase